MVDTENDFGQQPDEESASPEEDSGSQLLERIRNVLPQALQLFQGKDLATFAWKTGSGKEKKTVVRLKDVTRRRGTIDFTLAWYPEGTDAVEALATLNVSRTGVLWLNLGMLGRSKNWPLVDPANYQHWLEGGEPGSTYPKPKGAPGIHRLGEVWFPATHPPSLKDTGVIPLGPRRLPCIPEFESSWPKYNDDDGKWHVRLPPISTEAQPLEAWGAMALCFAIGSMLILLYQSSGAEKTPRELDPLTYGLPSNASYLPQRPVDLSPHEVRSKLKEKGLAFPWHLIEAACASLNAGKHLIFTGPPGCGKSKLAIELARLAMSGTEPLVVTASPAWTTSDLIGRYFPRRDGAGLEFKPGFFLRAIDDDRWLIIDEFNRADIDQCFGELFSALADAAGVRQAPSAGSKRGRDLHHRQGRGLPPLRPQPRRAGDPKKKAKEIEFKLTPRLAYAST